MPFLGQLVFDFSPLYSIIESAIALYVGDYRVNVFVYYYWIRDKVGSRAVLCRGYGL